MLCQGQPLLDNGMQRVNRGLTALDLEGNGMTDESCAALAKALHVCKGGAWRRWEGPEAT